MNTDEKINDFLDRICLWLPTKRLKARTRREFREHIEDGIDFYAEKGLPQKEAAEHMLKEMGDPFEINKELRKAHRGLLWLARLRNLLTVALVVFVIFNVLPPLGGEIAKFAAGSSLEEAEQEMYEQNEQLGVPIKFLHEQETSGKIYRIYYCIKEISPDETSYYAFTIETVTAFGKEFHSRFRYSGSNTEVSQSIPDSSPYASIIIKFIGKSYEYKVPDGGVSTRFGAWLIIFLEPANAKYFTVTFQPVEYAYSDGEAIPPKCESDFYEISKAPGAFFVEAPDKFDIGVITLYDENKQEIPYPMG